MADSSSLRNVKSTLQNIISDASLVSTWINTLSHKYTLAIYLTQQVNVKIKPD